MSVTAAAVQKVFVVDDQANMRSALQRLLHRAGFAVESYASGAAFLAGAVLEGPACILLDVSMPEMTGLEVQAELKKRRCTLPIVFLTGTADVPIAVAAMREGAVDFIQKPFDNDELVTRLRKVIEQDGRLRQSGGGVTRSTVLRGLESLTPREREVMELVVAGRTSKEIARIIGASHRTVEIHRGRMMQKMSAASVADLVRMRVSLSDAPYA